MSNQASHSDIRRLVDRLARRIRFQRAIDGAVTGTTLTAMIALTSLVLFKTGWIDESHFWMAAAGSLAAPLLLAAVGWFRKLDPVALAQRIDRAHSLHDRLSTALSLGETGPRSDFERAQIEDALKYVARVDLAPAAPFQRPADIAPLLALALAFGTLVVLRPPSNQHPLPEPPPIRHDSILDEATVAMEKDRLENIREELEGLQDPQAQELLDEIEKLLEDVEERALSEREFLERLEKLEEKYFDDDRKRELDRLTEKLKEAAEALEKEESKDLESDPEMKELVEALKKEDLSSASKAMEKIADKLMNDQLSEKQLERLAKLLEKFADKIDPEDPALKKLIEKNRELIEKLSKKMEKGLSEDEKKRLERAKQELQKLEQQAKKQEDSESTRQLKKIQRESKEASERATAKAKREDAEKSKKQQGQKDGQKGEGEKERFQNEAGRKAKQAADAMKKGGEQQQKDAAKEMARKQLQELREAMQRSGGQSGEGQGEQESAERGEKMKDFLRRAKGMKKLGEGEQGNEDREEGGGTRQVAGGEGKSNSESEFNPEIEGETNMAGKGKGSRELGEETTLDSRRKDVKVEGQEGKGPSRSEIIRAASEEGFATTEYKDVYGDYESVVEEVMEKEKVPAGYRYYIKRYFQLIQPQE